MFVRRRTVKMTVVNMLAELPLVAMPGARMFILNLLGPLIMTAIIGLFLRHPLVTVASIHICWCGLSNHQAATAQMGTCHAEFSLRIKTYRRVPTPLRSTSPFSEYAPFEPCESNRRTRPRRADRSCLASKLITSTPTCPTPCMPSACSLTLWSDEAKSTQPKTTRHHFSLVCTNPSACEASVLHIMSLNVDLARREVVRT